MYSVQDSKDIKRSSVKGQAYLRLKKTKNNQDKKIIWAKDYEL
jgi:hypothetical protein